MKSKLKKIKKRFKLLLQNILILSKYSLSKNILIQGNDLNHSLKNTSRYLNDILLDFRIRDVEEADILILTDVTFWVRLQGSHQRISSLLLYLKRYFKVKIIFHESERSRMLVNPSVCCYMFVYNL